MTQKKVKPVIQRTNTISSTSAEFSFQTKKIDVLRVKKIDKEIKQIYKYSFKYSIIQIYIIHNPRKKGLRYRKKQWGKKKTCKKQKNNDIPKEETGKI